MELFRSSHLVASLITLCMEGNDFWENTSILDCWGSSYCMHLYKTWSWELNWRTNLIFKVSNYRQHKLLTVPDCGSLPWFCCKHFKISQALRHVSFSIVSLSLALFVPPADAMIFQFSQSYTQKPFSFDIKIMKRLEDLSLAHSLSFVRTIVPSLKRSSIIHRQKSIDFPTQTHNHWIDTRSEFEGQRN